MGRSMKPLLALSNNMGDFFRSCSFLNIFKNLCDVKVDEKAAAAAADDAADTAFDFSFWGANVTSYSIWLFASSSSCSSSSSSLSLSSTSTPSFANWCLCSSWLCSSSSFSSLCSILTSCFLSSLIQWLSLVKLLIEEKSILVEFILRRGYILFLIWRFWWFGFFV